MTDKQIIIDGVDVSGCCQYMHRYMEDYDIDTLDYCRHHFKPCKDVNVKYCYYKQLKRKEQECEELKKTLTEIKEMCNSVENIENVKSLYDAALSGMCLQANKILKKISEVISE